MNAHSLSNHNIDSKDRVVGMRGDLENCNEWLQNKRFDLFHLWVKSIQNKEMVRILEIM